MPYVVLARKYRPRGFSALLGQEPVVRALSNALSQGRLHHAYLFTGTRGVGKTTVSRILAKALNCIGPHGQGSVTPTPCGVCMPCTSIDGGHFVDYVELDAASNRGVDDMSQLLDQAVYKPVVGRYKVYMIDEVHMLTTTAFNAMLKTLEEPPDYLKFVLATTDPQKVPATVLSRCLQFNLRPLAPDTVQSHLQAVLQAEQVAAEPGAVRLLARAARGSMRDALSITDQAIAYGGGAIAEAGVRAMLGTVDRGQAVRIAQALAAGDGPALIALADALHAAGQSAGGALDDLAQLFQELAVLQQAPESRDPLDADAAAAATLLSAFAADELQLYYSMALHCRADLALAPDEHGGLVMALLRLLAFRPPGAHRKPMPARVSVEREAGPPSAPDLVPRSATAGKPSVATPLGTSPPASAPLLRRTEARAVTAVPLTALPRAHDPQVADHVIELAPDRPLEPAAEPTERPPAAAPAPAQRADLVAERLPGAEADELPADRWDRLVRRLDASGAITALARELALQSDCHAVADDGGAAEAWHLRVDSETLRAPAQRDKLERAVVQLLGRPVRLEIAAGQPIDSPAIRLAEARRQRQADAERQIHEHPLVRTLLGRYPTARIVPGSIKPV